MLETSWLSLVGFRFLLSSMDYEWAVQFSKCDSISEFGMFALTGLNQDLTERLDPTALPDWTTLVSNENADSQMDELPRSKATKTSRDLPMIRARWAVDPSPAKVLVVAPGGWWYLLT